MSAINSFHDYSSKYNINQDSQNTMPSKKYPSKRQIEPGRGSIFAAGHIRRTVSPSSGRRQTRRIRFRSV